MRSHLNPFRNIYIAMTCTEPGTDNTATETLGERVDLATAIRCYTIESAKLLANAIQQRAQGHVEIVIGIWGSTT